VADEQSKVMPEFVHCCVALSKIVICKKARERPVVEVGSMARPVHVHPERPRICSMHCHASGINSVQAQPLSPVTALVLIMPEERGLQLDWFNLVGQANKTGQSSRTHTDTAIG